MGNLNRIGRLGIAAVGLGFGAVVASTTWVAAADPGDGTTTLLGASAAGDSVVGSAAVLQDTTAFDPNNLALSIDGITVLQNGSASASSGLGDIAFADGADSSATADGYVDIAAAEGVNSSALTYGSVQLAGAVGNGSEAFAESGAVDAAFANGDGSDAYAGGVYPTSLGYVDAAFANGAGSDATAGGVAGNAGSVDLASATGVDVTALAQNGPFDAVFEPSPAAADLVGDGLGSTASLSDLWSELLTLF